MNKDVFAPAIIYRRKQVSLAIAKYEVQEARFQLANSRAASQATL